ncbi:hypothetical protein [Pseudomonas sp. 35 E 8]|nr:hypothetical protein [Pseudomonas sp. 35 E 8]
MPKGISQQCLLPIGQDLPVDARLFFMSSFALINRSCSSCKRRTSSWRDSSCRCNSSRSGDDEGSSRHFMDGDTSGPNSWFFQLYKVGLHTPSF